MQTLTSICAQLAAPKSKYVETILVATHTGEAGVAEVFRTLQHRLRDSAWTIVFKALIIVHLLIREGQQDAALSYLSDNPKKIAPSNFSEGESTAQSGVCNSLMPSGSAITGTEYPTLCRVPDCPRESVRRHTDRLRTQRTGAFEASERR